MQTKACNLTEDEVKTLMNWHGYNKVLDEESIERINYLHRRLKSFKEPEVTEQVKSINTTAGWGGASEETK